LYRALEPGEVTPAEVEALTRSQKRALEALARSLLPKLRGQDREALGRLLAQRGAVDTARKDRHSKRVRVRAKAGEFLGDSGSPTAVRDLIELLQDHDPRVRWSAARALGRLGHSSALSPLLASLEGPRALPVDAVADAVIQIRSCPVAVLRQGLRSRSVASRAVAVELLGRFQALAAIDEVIERLHDDPSVEVRARAARALGRMSSFRAVDALLMRVDDGPVAMRVQAIWALGEIGDPRVLPVLRDLVLEPARQMAGHAASALLIIGSSGADVLITIAEGGGRAASVAAGALASRQVLQRSSPRSGFVASPSRSGHGPLTAAGHTRDGWGWRPCRRSSPVSSRGSGPDAGV
jgi:HEAT repeat protein